MKNKLIAVVIIIALILVGISYYAGIKIGVQKGISETETRLAPQIKSSEILNNLLTILNSKLPNSTVAFTVFGKVKQVSENSLVLIPVEDSKDVSPVKILIAENAEIGLMYILPKGAPQEEIVASDWSGEGKERFVGRKQSNLGEIKDGDRVQIYVSLKSDGILEGTSIEIYPPGTYYGDEF